AAEHGGEQFVNHLVLPDDHLVNFSLDGLVRLGNLPGRSFGIKRLSGSVVSSKRISHDAGLRVVGSEEIMRVYAQHAHKLPGKAKVLDRMSLYPIRNRARPGPVRQS